MSIGAEGENILLQREITLERSQSCSQHATTHGDMAGLDFQNSKVLDKHRLKKVLRCPKCGKRGSLHRRWITNGRTSKKYYAYYVAHYNPAKHGVK